jgi:hypothetical protein
MRKMRTPGSTQGGVLALVFWLIIGFGLTECTAIALNAWMMNNPNARNTQTAATIQGGVGN